MSRWHTTDWDLLPERAFGGVGHGKWHRMTLEGGKGSSAPAPDPALIAAQIKSMGIQDSAVQQIIANSNALQPLQMTQMQQAIDAAGTAQKESAADRQYALGQRDKLTGLQDRMVTDAQGFNTGARTQELQAQGLADVNSAFSNAAGQTTRAMERAGVNPNSGKMVTMANQTGLAQAAALAGASNGARTQARNEGYALTDRATNALSGFPSLGLQTTAAGAQYGTAGLGLANTGLAGMNSGFGAAGTAAGQMGSNATSMYGAQANYKLASDRAAADADPFGALLGAGSQLGAAYIGTLSDRRLKENVTPAGRDERTGLPLYEFNYRDRPGERYRGVMADEVRERYPEAVKRGADGFDRVDYGMLGIEFKGVTP